MGMAQKLADDVGSSIEGIHITSGRVRVVKQITAAVAATATGDWNTALTASTTTYNAIWVAPKAMTLVKANIRAAAAGKGATTLLDIGYAASGTAVTSMTTMVTQLDCSTLTADTDKKLTINTNGTQNIPANATIFVKLVTIAAETLTPPVVDLVFRL